MDRLVHIVLEASMWAAVVALPFMVMYYALHALSTLASAMYNRICNVQRPSGCRACGRGEHTGEEDGDLAFLSSYDHEYPSNTTVEEERLGMHNVELKESPRQQWTPQEINELWEEFYGNMCEEELDNLSNHSPR